MAAADYCVADFGEMDGVPCPCGLSRRAFTDIEGGACSLHRVTISEDAQTHYHRRLTEVYYFLEGAGHMELDGEMVPVRPGMAVYIPPGVRHRAVVGDEWMVVLNFVTPPFDPHDEWGT